MSGSMMPQQGGAPQGGMPQIPPQLLAMLAQRGGAGGPPVPQMPMGGAPGGMPPGAPPMGPPGGPPQGAPPPGGPPMQPPQPMSQVPPMAMPGGPMQQNLAAFGRMAQGGPGGQQPRLTPQEMAHLGRFGDQVIAHLTPGEMTVPPQVQTPKVMHDLTQAFHHVGVSPAQFTAGSPASSVNPNTGAPEYSLWSAILPVLGSIGGAVAAPYTGGLSVPAGMAIGGALGGAAGGAMDHGTAMQIALQAAGGGAGGYLGGAMGGAGSAAGSGAANAANAASAASSAGGAGMSGASMTADPFAGSSLAATQGAASPAASNLSSFGQMMKSIPLKGGMMAGTGAALGGALAPQPVQASAQPPGFNTPNPGLTSNYNALLGRPNQSPTPQFGGYNPYASVTGQPYNFFPNGG